MEELKAFDFRAAFERLIARNPSLRSDPSVSALLSQGDAVKEIDVLEVVQELLVRPGLTVATVGCFRPRLSRLVDNLVQSLRQLWRQGRTTSADGSGMLTSLTQLHLGSVTRPSMGGWDLTIHEYAVIAFSLILELAPYLLSSLLQYFTFAPPPFERLLLSGVQKPGASRKSALLLLDVVRASYRFLQLEPKIFRELWDWSPFLDLLQWTPISMEEDLTTQISSDVRWCAIQVVVLYFNMSDAATWALSSTVSNLTEEAAFACRLRWESCCQDIAVEKAGMYLDSTLGLGTSVLDRVEEKGDSSFLGEYQTAVKWKSDEGTKFSHVEIFGIELPVRQDLRDGRELPFPSKLLVLTPTVKKNLEAVVLALSQRHPVLLEGPLGAGKSSLIQELANITGNSDVIFLHLDDQMDSKTLLGNYICTEIPGEFKWQPGALTQAVLQGMWVVFEDIDRAPFEIFSTLIPILEDRKLYIPGRGEMIHAAENFRLFSTVTQTKIGSMHSASGGRKEMLSNLWRRVVVDSPSNEELAIIMRAHLPSLVPLVPKLIGTLKLLKAFAFQSMVQVEGNQEISVYIGRQFSTRDLLKWGMRIAALEFPIVAGTVLSSYVRDRIYSEAVDCFAGSIASVTDRQVVMRAIAGYWDVPLESVEYLSMLNKPTLQMSPSSLQVGRATLTTQLKKGKAPATRVFANTGYAMRTLEAIAMCVQQQEPVLLVGETGTGKTTLVQYLAHQIGMPLIVLNMSQQTDSSDFLGGFKPVEAQGICIPLFETFNHLFKDTFPKKKNAELLEQVQRLAERKKWERLLKAFRTVVASVAKLVGASFPSNGMGLGPGPPSTKMVMRDDNGHKDEEQTPKRKRPLNDQLHDKWRAFSIDLHKAERQVEAAKTGFAFSFVEGVLIKAIREGRWLLLDEVNLAPVETLERLTGVLEGEGGSLCLTERGDVESVVRHPNFRIFGCMNPATDVGKHDLPIALKNRFTELYIDELTRREDLHALVYKYLEGALPSPPVEEIVNFYLQARKEAETRLLDGAGQKPQYSLRSLARALEYTRAAMPIYGFQRAIYDGICMSFLTLLDSPSALVMEQLISAALFKQTGLAAAKALKALLKVPPQPSPEHVLFEHFWVESGHAYPSRSSLESRDRYVLTETIRNHLKNLARAVFVRKYPVLLQGPTSSGKTSLVEYLATITGHRFVRINNHEHTDLQEYLGSYVTDSSGKLVFQEGILVEAVRKGYWIVLDELNLAPSDVLEALNRLLDDNRELFVPELQVTVKPHPHFMLFATQNPPGIYGGRKVLSRAFRNRFMELHIDDIPDDELRQILEKRCQIPGSYAGKMVEVMKDLQRHRQSSKVFAGKHGFITSRDLFRWAERHGNGYEELARDGYMLLAERLRDGNEKAVVQTVLEKHMRVKIDVNQLHEIAGSEKLETLQECLKSPESLTSFGKIVWTKSMKRLFNLVEHCIRHCEPVLLIGETGCGKTTICQLLALLFQQRLHILNCHQYSETSDFLGGLRPVRERDSIGVKFQNALREVSSLNLFQEVCKGELPSKIEDAAVALTMIRQALSNMKKLNQNWNEKSKGEVEMVEALEKELSGLQKEWQSLFVWHDGPLVQAMRDGDFFLVDEISLADDSVLERLNSVLEPKRLLVLAEKGGPVVVELIAHPNFCLLATMNPGGDFGKKELSPALRNRFTEIWVPPISDPLDLKSIVSDRFSKPELISLADPLLQFWQWFQHHHESGRILSVRDLLAWITYINVAEKEIGKFAAFVHGAFVVLLDGIGFGMGLSNAAAQQLKSDCLNHLLQQLPEDERVVASEALSLEDQRFEPGTASGPNSMEVDVSSHPIVHSNNMFGIHPFFIRRGDQVLQRSSFTLAAPTTSRNALRILRAMQLSKPVLLEGSPGVGKTSLVAALASSSGHTLVRINLSEQTDIMDLLGSDLPVEGGKGAEFRWSDGVFLQALKAGNWVLLDELNLASQSVLEGLNACLDHRGEVFIPELGRSFKCPPTFRVFACQNPLSQGGGRKGLPKSFLNRFTKVYMDALSEDDFMFIANALHPSIPEPLLLKMIEFNARLHHDTMVVHAYGHSGVPWEFNLRDILRWCQLIEAARDGSSGCQVRCDAPENFLDVIYLQRMRTTEDRRRVLSLFQHVFGTSVEIDTCPMVSVHPDILHVGLASLPRTEEPLLQGSIGKQLQLLPGLVNRLEAVMHCVAQGWMCILVGPPASGKTSLVRLLAALTGNPVREFSLSSATDTTELLGCFEQYDLFRRWQETVRCAYDSLKTISSFCFTVSGDTLRADLKVNLVKNLLGSWAAFHKCIVTRGTQSSLDVLSLDQQLDQGVVDSLAVDMLLHTVEQLRQAVVISGMVVEDSALDPRHLLQRLRDIKGSLGQFGKAGQFEWVEGDLLKALERGDWVVLDNANFCNPTVLDRLNPLLEPGGTIMINERGLVNGEAMVVRAHPNFRLFLTVDPSHGEVSRAMRNRGVEVYMLQPDWLESGTPESGILEELQGGASSADLDSLKLLIHAGIPGPSLVQAMCKAHVDIQGLLDVSHSGSRVSLREVWQWVSLMQQLLERGASLGWSLQCSWEQTYAHRLGSADARKAAMEKFHTTLGAVGLVDVSSWRKVALPLPGGWPNPLTLAHYCLNSKETMVLRDSMFVRFLGAQFFAFKTSVEWHSLIQAREPLEWLQSKGTMAAYFPATLLRYFLNPVEGVLRETKDQTVAPLDALALDQTLWFAGLWMIEQASFLDLKLRIEWLHTFGKMLDAQVLRRLATALEKELDHPVRGQWLAAWRKCLGPSMDHGIAPKFFLQIFPPIDDSRALEMVDAREAWSQVVSFCSKLQALRRSLLQWESEDEVYEMVEKWGLNSSASPIVQSYWQYTHPAERSHSYTHQVSKLTLKYLYTFFTSLRKLEDEVLTLADILVWDSSIDATFRKLQEWHEALWRNVSVSKFDVESFLFCWSWGKRSLQHLMELPGIAGSGVTKVADFLQHLVEMIDKPFSLGQNPLSKPLLWKFAGHPQLAHTKELQDQERQVSGLCESYWSPVSEGSAAGVKQVIRADCNVRRLVMTGLSIIRWLGQETSKEGFGSRDMNPLNGNNVFTISANNACYESQEIFEMLAKRLESEETQLSQLRSYDIIPLAKSSAPELASKGGDHSGCRCTPWHGPQPSFPARMLQWPTAWTLWSELLPWLDHSSLCMDTALLGELSPLAANNFDDDGALRIIEKRIRVDTVKEMLEFGLACSSRSPADFVPHQHLLWFLDAAHPTETVHALQDMMAGFRDMAHEMWVRWHSALWNKPSGSSDLSLNWTSTSGPPRLFQGAQTVILSNLLCVTNLKDFSMSSSYLFKPTSVIASKLGLYWAFSSFRDSLPTLLVLAVTRWTSSGQPGLVRDHRARVVQLRVAALHLWRFSKHWSFDLFKSLFCSASGLFQQIIYAHCKSFSTGDVEDIRTALFALHEGVLQENQGEFRNHDKILKDLAILLERSRHVELLSVVNSLVLPCLEALYFIPWRTLCSTEKMSKFGQVWLLLGSLRLRMLLPADGRDPVAKYSHKYTHILTNHSNLELEIKVKKESEFLVRGKMYTPEIRELLSKLKGMKQELDALSLKVIPRPNPPQFRDLVNEVLHFLQSSASTVRLAALVGALQEETHQRKPDFTRTLQEVTNWQENAAHFISRLTSEFPAYRDVVQPIQLAVYELKFGLSLVLAAHMQSVTFGEGGVNQGEDAFVELLCILMEYPMGRALCPSGKDTNGEEKVTWATSMDLVTDSVEKIVSQVARSQNSSYVGTEALDVELKVMVLRVALLRIGLDIQQARFKGKAAMKALDEILSSFTALWAEIHDQQNARKDKDAELVRFTSRTHAMDTEAELDEASFLEMFPDFASEFPHSDDGPAFASAQEDDRQAQAALAAGLKDEGRQMVEKAWLAIKESLLEDVVRVHNMFGCSNLSEMVSDKERTHVFTLAYETGMHLIKAVGHSVPARLEERVMAAHLMRVTLEHQKLEELSKSADNQTAKCTIYESNAPEMALILNPLACFLERVGKLLEEWPEHPILQQLLTILKALLSISLDAPVMKALTGLKLLLAKAQLWEESAAKHVSIAGEMDELMQLVRRWQDLELKSWPALLESTQRQHEFKAEEMWFSLRGLLHQQHGDSLDSDIQETTDSIDQFLLASTLGGFGKHLDMVIAFYGQFSLQDRCNVPLAGVPRDAMIQKANILYNLFKYYSQFLPAVEETLSMGRGPIEKNLEGLVKKSKWENRGYYALAHSAEKTHRELHKLIRKYDELLKQPLIQMLSKQALRMGSQTLASLTSSSETSELSLREVSDLKPSQGNLASSDYGVERAQQSMASQADDWAQFCEAKVSQMTKLAGAVPQDVTGMYQKRLPLLTSKMGRLLGTWLFSSAGRQAQEEETNVLETIATAVIVRSAELRKGEKRLAVKKKALVDLLKALRQIGLSYNKSAVPKDERDPRSWFRQPPSEVGTLLNFWKGQKTKQDLEGEGEANRGLSLRLIETSWKAASDYYFKNITLVRRLHLNARDFNKALSLREVEVSQKYMEHLLYFQRKQRRSAHEFTAKLGTLANLTSLLATFGNGETSFPRQRGVRKWMWQQKDLIDSLCHVMAEALLLFKTSDSILLCPSESGQSEVGLLKTTLTKLLANLEGCKNVLDGHLIPSTNMVGSQSLEDCWPLLITPAMHQALQDNFSVIKSTEESVQSMCEQTSGHCVPGLNTLQQLLHKGLDMSGNFESEITTEQNPEATGKLIPFMELYDTLISEILLAVQNLSELKPGTDISRTSNDSAEAVEGTAKLVGTIQSWDLGLTEQMSALRLDRVYNTVVRVLSIAEEIVDAEDGTNTAMTLARLLGGIHVPLAMLQAAGMQILVDYVHMQRTVSKLGYILSNLFSALYTDGFCVTKEEEGEEGGTKFEDADGTGMGEGEGKKDVSDQIEDEDQLLGSTEKNEEAPATEDVGKKGEKGIEMEQDFEGDMLDISEDESEEEGDTQDEDGKLDSKMGDVGDKSEIIDEQLWNDNDDDHEGQEDGKEKYEKDAPISGASQDNLELRAKEDQEDSGGKDGDPEENEGGVKDPEAPAGPQDDSDQVEEMEESGMDRDESYEDPSGIKPCFEEELQLPDDLNLDGEGENKEAGEDMGGENNEPGPDEAPECGAEEQSEAMNIDEESKGLSDIDEGIHLEEQKGKSLDESEEAEKETKTENDNTHIDREMQGREENRSEEDEANGSEQQDEGHIHDQPMTESQEAPVMDPGMHPKLNEDARASGGTGTSGAISGVHGDPLNDGIDEAEAEQMGTAEVLPKSNNPSQIQQSALENITGDKRSSVLDPDRDSNGTPSLDRLDANPYRSLGDALKKWKERVQLVDNSSAPEVEMVSEEGEPEAMDEDRGVQYEYVSKEEVKGNAQALGAATDEQLAQRQDLQEATTQEEAGEDNLPPGLEESMMERKEEESLEVESTQLNTSMKKQRSLDAKQARSHAGDRLEDNNLHTIPQDLDFSFELEQRSKGDVSLVSLRSQQPWKQGYSDDEKRTGSNGHVDVQPWSEEELRDVRKDLEQELREGDGSADAARVMWQKYEQLTARLSQELAEQLRLILEPTLAAKLQGDYRSGKRINMKKVIPYVASQFRKDKIWLRRTKASKRQYQVVLAIDDSRSMSESHCGHLALEALITISRAMSQLEIGQMAVASFGAKGNVHLLHDFDQPFSSEAGVNMVSSFTFNQDNKIDDEPMVDLLHYLTRMLETVARHAAAPSGQNNLQQLVLIIADGRFHEKESLRRCVRDAMNRRQLLAFLVLDNPQESILDMQSVSFSNGPPSFSKYLDGFPFPYYIVLQDIEALPRTLADLLRQWFELMQQTS